VPSDRDDIAVYRYNMRTARARMRVYAPIWLSGRTRWLVDAWPKRAEASRYILTVTGVRVRFDLPDIGLIWTMLRRSPRAEARLTPPVFAAWPPLAPPASEGPGFDFFNWQPCNTFRAQPGSQCGVEWDEWQIVRALVHANATVLEVGARFGTTSCALAETVGRHGVVVAAEPDRAVTDMLLHNLQAHRCSNVHVLHGTISSVPLRIGAREGRGGVGTRTFLSAANASDALPRLSVRSLEAKIGRRIDTLLLDCEGCIDTVLGGGQQATRLLRQLQLILIEQDGDHVARYQALWWPRLQAHGFVRAWRSYSWYSGEVQHTAWTKGAQNLACEMAARRESERRKAGRGRALRCTEDLR
jgi:FkbM family methyltransferase